MHPRDVRDTRSDSLKPPQLRRQTTVRNHLLMSSDQNVPTDSPWFSVRAHMGTNHELDPDPSLVGTRRGE